MKENRTVRRAVDFLLFIADRPSGVSMEELCRHFDLPRTSAYDILVTLTQAGMLEVLPGSPKRYVTGLSSYRIGLSYRDANDELPLIGRALKSLAAETGRTAFFGTLSGQEVVYLLKEIPENPIITTATVGSCAPLYCTSLGKALLASLTEEEAERLIGQLDFSPRTAFTITDPAVLAGELTVIRKRGYASDVREYEDHMACVSAPVRRADGTVAGAVSLAAFYRPEDDYEALGEQIRAEAARISQLLGFRIPESR